MTDTVRGNPEATAIGLVHSPSPRQIMTACMAGDGKWKDVPAPGLVER